MNFSKPANLVFEGKRKGISHIVTSLGMTLVLQEYGGIDMPIELGVLALPSENRPADMPEESPYFNLQRPSIEMAHLYVHLERMMGYCSQKGEEVNRLFAGISHSLFCNGISDTVNVLELQKTIKGLDFMTLKNLIMDYIKNNVQYEDLASKKFRKSLDDFIICRNIFTHGKLRIAIPPGDIFYIEHVDNHTKGQAFMELNMDVIKDYNQAYIEVKEFIGMLEKELRKENKLSVSIEGASCRVKKAK